VLASEDPGTAGAGASVMAHQLLFEQVDKMVVHLDHGKETRK
jgi:hypothetical protein